MRIAFSIFFAAVTIGLIMLLDSTLLPAPLGRLLSPQHGFWQNAEKTNEDFSADLKFPQLSGKVSVYLDDRLVPHVFAEQENDAYFVQGYLHAKFRLWQMELQTFSAAGRLSEFFGDRALNHDREFRRLGMVYAAERAEQEMNKDAAIKAECDAYTAGVNAYINSLTESTLPVEYKLLRYKPEPWNNLKTMLFLKYMCYDLAGRDEDFEMTSAKNYFNGNDFAQLYPYIQDSLDPIIPKGTVLPPQTVFPKAPADADSLYMQKGITIGDYEKPDKENGSNNWAVSGKKTKSGAPILCNDPHLGLNLPSLWYEIQISTPSFNAYGVSFPGAPGVVIGFNDSCAFGVTNGGRDVKDFYSIRFKDDSRKEYLFNGTYNPTKFRVDTIRIKDKPDFIDSVAYVLLGNDWCPVMFDKTYTGNRTDGKGYYAVRWKAHDPSLDLKYFNLMNRAKNYNDYQVAAEYFHAPGQNCVFACKNGDIAIRTQGEWPAKWKGQGDFIMPGTDTSYLWQGMIPQSEVPYQYNPERGFVSSANQKPVDDKTYPYYLGREYPMYRGIAINRRLSAMNNITPEDMEQLQTDNYNVFAAMAMPLFLKNLDDSKLNADEKKYADLLRGWNLRNDVGSKGATVFEILWNNVKDTIYDDEFAKAPKGTMKPFESSLLEGLLKDSAYKFADNINTPEKETVADDVLAAFKRSAQQLKQLELAGKLDWEKYKATHIDHLTKLEAFSRRNLPIGGGTNNINAAKENHGPSWRMVVSLTEKTEAYGVYPGGQSGNPGSKYYDNFVDQWVAGKYNLLWMMTKDETKDKRVKAVMQFTKG
ncbi:MAG: penicillin acylase family protein [Bacteroidetes bacterium]|nr:penicillin acylase family protein [Bacteroidota bacterium]